MMKGFRSFRRHALGPNLLYYGAGSAGWSDLMLQVELVP